MPSRPARALRHPRLILAALLLPLGPVTLASAAGQAVAPAAPAASAPGFIEGRVLNPRSGDYLEGARVTLDGTAFEEFTDATGQFRLSQIPAGTHTLRIFYTGFDAHTESLVLAPGATAVRDVSLRPLGAAAPAAAPGKPGAAAPIQLDAFTVATSREMDGAALAINEQRFAGNMRTVASTDEFGNVAEGNAAEFIKFLPGVTIDYTGGNARDISINGVPSDNVPVTVDGFNVATASGLGTGRAVQSDMISINNLSRIEVSYSPTPESQGSALAGSVNMVPRSAFERSRPQLNTSAYLVMRDNARDFKKVPGPKPTPTRNVHPGLDFSYVRPVSKNFGYTLSGGYSTNYSPQDNAQPTWRGVTAVTNGTPFAHTTPDRPYLSAYRIQDAPKVTVRRSVGFTADWKFTPHDRLSLGFQFSSFDGRFVVHNLTYNTGGVLAGNFDLFNTRGTPGLGDLTMSHQERNRYNRTHMPTMVWRHDGPVWKADLGLGLSQQSDYNRDAEQGFFRNFTVRRTGVTVDFADAFYLRPRVISVRDAAGAPLDPHLLSNYAVISATTQRDKTYDLQRNAYGSLRRDFFTAIPFTLKTGFDLRQSIRDTRGGTLTYNYVGPDGRPSTTPVGSDDSAQPFFDPIWSERVMPFGFPKIQGPSNRKLWERYAASPAHFTVNENTNYRNTVTNSKYAEELTSAVYLRGDVSLFRRSLKLVGGVRAEQTNVDAAGPLNDPTLNFQRDAAGNILRGPTGAALLRVPATDALGVSRLTYLDRGSGAEKEYLRILPSLNASWTVRENLVARAAYYHSLGRPNFNQYAGGITLPDTGRTPLPTDRIVVNNAAIKAWSAESRNVRLEYYFAGVGQISLGAFRRDIDNFFGASVFNATPAFLALYNLDPAVYDIYDVATQQNLPGTVRVQGFDFSYKQALTFLPRWARGVQVFANASAQRVLGDATADFAGYIPRSGSWGVSLTREKYNLRVNWNYRGRQRQAPVAESTSIGPGTFNWGSKRLYVDVLGEYYFWKRVGLFVNLRNVGAAVEDTEVAGPLTPAHAQFRLRIDYASLWTIGLKATF